MSIAEVLFTGFAVCAFLQLAFYLAIFLRLALLKQSEKTVAQLPISVIICARNESRNLLDNLPLIFEQKYPEFQVIVVDDCSLDDTQDVLRAFSLKHDNLHVVTMQETNMFSGGKKFAMTLGIKGAKYDHLLFTDADCQPQNQDWISEMAAGFSEGKQVVLGYGGYEKQPGLLNRVIRFDAYFIALQYLSFALAGFPYMGVGRNLAYQKELFFNNKGFSKHQHVASGDDDLFMNEVLTASNFSIVVKEGETRSTPKGSLKDWTAQKRRHLTTATHYKLKHKLLLGTLAFSHLFFYIGFFGLLTMGYQINLILTVFLSRLLIQLFVFYRSMKLLGEQDLLVWSPVLELVLTVYYPFLGLMNLLFKQTGWKR